MLDPIVMQDVSFAYGNMQIVRKMSLKVSRHEFLALVGPSGCGKTTLLQLLAGELQAQSGEVHCSGNRRTVYQQGSLFPWLTVQKNIALSCAENTSQTDRLAQAEAILDWVDLRAFANHYPHELSGGMRQRVELARALSGKPDVLLLDEPFSALDYLTRLRMRRELSTMIGQKPCTTILVTHDIEEAAQMADRVLVLGSNPMTCRAELEINVARPRQLTQPRVIQAIRELMIHLGVSYEDQSSKTNLSAEHAAQ